MAISISISPTVLSIYIMNKFNYNYTEAKLINIFKETSLIQSFSFDIKIFNHFHLNIIKCTTLKFENRELNTPLIRRSKTTIMKKEDKVYLKEKIYENNKNSLFFSKPIIRKFD